MRFNVVSKASGNEGISPVAFSQIDGPLQRVEVAVAKLQYGDADPFQKLGIFSEACAAFVGQQRSDEGSISLCLNSIVMRGPIPAVNGALIY